MVRITRRTATIRDEFKAQLVHVKLQARFQVANENDDVLDA